MFVYFIKCKSMWFTWCKNPVYGNTSAKRLGWKFWHFQHDAMFLVSNFDAPTVRKSFLTNHAKLLREYFPTTNKSSINIRGARAFSITWKFIAFMRSCWWRMKEARNIFYRLLGFPLIDNSFAPNTLEFSLNLLWSLRNLFDFSFSPPFLRYYWDRLMEKH